MLSKACVKWPLPKIPKIGFQGQLSPNAGQKYYRMLQGKHTAILSTFIQLPFVILIFVLSIFERPFYTGFTVLAFYPFSTQTMILPTFKIDIQALLIQYNTC